MIRIQWTTNSTIREPDVGGDTIEMIFQEIVIDATISESPEISAACTEHPVEVGSDITDHVHPGIDRITLECIVSNTPTSMQIDNSISLGSVELPVSTIYSIRQPSRLGEQEQQVSQNIPAKYVTAFIYPSIDRPKDVFDSISRIIREGTIVDILGLRLGDLFEYVLTSLSPTIDQTDSMKFTLSAQKIKTVELSTTEAPSPRIERGRRREQTGNQSATSGQQENSEHESILRSAVGEALSGARESAQDIARNPGGLLDALSRTSL